MRTLLLFYIHYLQCLWNQSLDPYYFIFVLLTRKALLIIVNVYKMQLFNLCVANMSGIVDNCECLQHAVI